MPKRNDGRRKYWAFTPDGKQFFSLRLFEEAVDETDLLDAYNRHPKRLSVRPTVDFVYRDDATNQILRRVSVADILAYEGEMRQIQEDAALQDEESRRSKG